MEDYHLKILTKQSFDYLTDEEKTQLAEWCSNDDEFQGLKSLFAIVETSRSSFQENVKTKSQLDELFVSKYKSANGINWRSFLFPSGVIFFRQPAFQMAFGILLIFGVSFFFVKQSPVQVAKNNVPKSEKKKSKSDSENKKLQGEKTLETFSDSESTAIVNERNVSNSGTDKIASTIVSEDSFVKLEQTDEAKLADFEGYTSEKFAEDYSLAEKDKDFVATPIQPVSSKPSVLDLLYTAY